MPSSLTSPHNLHKVETQVFATLEEMVLTVLIPIVVVAPWLAGLAWYLTRAPRMTDPPLSYFESAAQRLSVR